MDRNRKQRVSNIIGKALINAGLLPECPDDAQIDGNNSNGLNIVENLVFQKSSTTKKRYRRASGRKIDFDIKEPVSPSTMNEQIISEEVISGPVTNNASNEQITSEVATCEPVAIYSSNDQITSQIATDTATTHIPNVTTGNDGDNCVINDTVVLNEIEDLPYDITKEMQTGEELAPFEDPESFLTSISPHVSVQSSAQSAETNEYTYIPDKELSYSLNKNITLNAVSNTSEPRPSTSKDADVSPENLTSPVQIKDSNPTQPKSTDRRRGRKRNCKADIKYMDYLSDEDFSTLFGEEAVDSDVWEESETADSDNLEEGPSNKNKKKKKKIAKKSTRQESKKQNKNEEEEVVGEAGLKKKKKGNLKDNRSRLRKSGQEFENKDGSKSREKTVQPNPCTGKKCGNKCENVSEEKRKQVFDHYWNLEVVRRRDWLISLARKEPIKRKRASNDTRTVCFKYFINEGEGKRAVCSQFLAATLDISQKCIYYTVKNSSWGCAKEDFRGKSIPPNKTKPDSIEAVTNFIKSLPAVPSHYCRQDSSRVYLPQEFRNISYLYNIYKTRFSDGGMDFVSEKVFRKIFTEKFNIGFHVPKKDKCVKCLQFEQTKPTDPAKVKEIADHAAEKEESYNRFSAHKQIHKSDPSTLCSSFDLEKVLNTPHGESMLLYYSRKLAVYNLCFYENGTRRVFCYYWDESNGKRGANEIASILQKYIMSVDARGNIKNLLLYCDCCPGQNRNRIVLAMIHSTLQECRNIETIQINYLLTGHTYMPVDSVHGVIESNLKNTIIHAPSQWYTVFTTARRDPFPYEVERITFRDFLKWDIAADKYFKGNLMGKISKIRIATFKNSKRSTISVKYSMDKSAPSSDIECQSKTKGPLMPCYKAPLPICKAKYDDLNKLCKNKVIPPHFHGEYQNLPQTSTAPDTLADSDIEDEFLSE